MKTIHAVEVLIEATSEGRHEGTCSCSCGWTLTTSAPTEQLATRIADKARANHFEDAHPQQPAYAAQVAQAPERGHSGALGGAVKNGFLWERLIVCACGWEATTTGATPAEAAAVAREQHRRHEYGIDHAASTAAPDRLVLLGLAVLVVAVIAAIVFVAVHTSAR